MWLKYGVIISVICCLVCSGFSAYFAYSFTDAKWVAEVALMQKERATASTQLLTKFRMVDKFIIESQGVSDGLFQVAKNEQATAKVAADAAFDSLHNKTKPALPRPTSPNSGSPTAAELAAAATDRLVQAELFRRADEAAGRYAEFALESRIAGLDCQRRYEIIRKSHNEVQF